MVITKDLIKEKFIEYNNLYFNGELPEPRFSLLHSFKMYGMFACDKCIFKGILKHPRISVTCYYDFDEIQLKLIMVHEMIHYFLAFKHKDLQLSHGEEFHKMCETINKEYGLTLSDKSYFLPPKAKNAPKLLWWLVRHFY